MKNYIGIVRDHSGSMAPLERAATKDYNETIAAIKKAAIREGQDTIVSVAECSGRGVRVPVVNSSIASLRSLEQSDYRSYGGTPLLDAVGTLIEQFEKTPDASDEDVSFIITAITDGEENISQTWSWQSLSEKIRELQATDRWTFVFRVPRRYGAKLANNLGISRGNIQEWEQTEEGLQRASVETQSAYDGYYQLRTSGLRSTKSFYTTDLSDVNKASVKKALHDVTSQVKFFDVKARDDKTMIKDFVEAKTRRPMLLGSAFYQLTKKEKEVQDHKKIAVRDKKNGRVFYGAAARQILGLPDTGTISLVPGDHGEFDIFVQSTSVNRKLVGGSEVMHWPNAASFRR